MWIYINGDAFKVNYKVGDIVRHKLNKKKYIVVKIYNKLNKVVVENEFFKAFESTATSFEKVEEYVHDCG